MKRPPKVFLLVLILSLLTASQTVFAQEETYGDYFYAIGTKFVRGAGHILTSLADIPCTTVSEMREDAATGFFTGVGKGTLLMLRRIIVGATEIGTFMIPAERTIPPACSTNSLSILL